MQARSAFISVDFAHALVQHIQIQVHKRLGKVSLLKALLQLVWEIHVLLSVAPDDIRTGICDSLPLSILTSRNPMYRNFSSYFIDA